MSTEVIELNFEHYFHLEAPSEQRKKALRIYHVYRLSLAVVIVMGYWWGLGFFSEEVRFPQAFLTIAFGYLVASVLFAYWGRVSAMQFSHMLIAEAFLDSLFLSAMIFTGLGVQSGMGILLNVSLAALSILLPGLTAVFFAALMTIALIVQHLFTILLNIETLDSEFIVGLHGVSFFATAITAYMLAKRVEKSDRYAAHQRDQAENLSLLNESIIAHMNAGVIVIDREGMVRMMNHSAYAWLGISGDTSYQPLSVMAPRLVAYLDQYKQDEFSKDPFTVRDQGPLLLVQRSCIGRGEDQNTLIVLEDLSRMTQQAQQLKLASLGRFTASMAHELRNPLGAISHAVQLLMEELPAGSAECRLGKIIQTQSQRMNQVIKNILQLSRQRKANIERVELNSWIGKFIEEYQQVQPAKIQMEYSSLLANLEIQFDPHQLHQVLSSLCDNSQAHANPSSGELLIILKTYLNPLTQKPILDILDNGRGISHESAEHIFEPFFTTSRQGTGLGLYVAHELCLYNQAQLSHQPVPMGACFRIEFQ